MSVKPGHLIRLQATTDGKQVKWFVNDPDNADLIAINSEKAAIFSCMTPGVYRVFAYTAIGDAPSDPAVCVITVGGVPPKPPPGPGPTPHPDPPPGPPVGAIWFIVVDDITTRTPATGKLLGDTAFWASLKPKQVDWAFYDKTSPTVARNKYDKLGDAMPYYIIADKDGNLIKHGGLPQDKAGVLSILKDVGR